MSFEIKPMTRATLTRVTPRTEVHGDDRVFAISLGLKLDGPNTLLDKLSPTLRHALYKAVPAQDQLPGIEAVTPVLRTRLIEEVKIGPSSLEGWTLMIDHGFDENEPITIGACRVDKFRCVPKEGGSIVLMFRVGSNDIDATQAGLLCSHLSQEISLTLAAPEKPAGVIDGSNAAFKADHPDATDLFSQVAGGQGPGEGEDEDDEDEDEENDDDDEGPTLDMEARADHLNDPAWPFPDRPNSLLEAPPQAVLVERSQPGTRTARGREKTAKALAEGAQRAGSAAAKAPKAAVKYRDASTGETWSGRGLQPKWLKAALARGKTLADFENAASTASAKPKDATAAFVAQHRRGA